MNFINKWVLNSWEFHYPNFMVFCQLLLFTIVITLLRATGKLTDKIVLSYTLERGKQLCILSVLYITNVILALFALSGMNIPMYNAMRRCVPIASLILGPCIYPQRTTTSIVGAIILITAGTITAANGDLDFDIKSYSFGVCSVLSQVILLIFSIFNNQFHTIVFQSVCIIGYFFVPLIRSYGQVRRIPQ